MWSPPLQGRILKRRPEMNGLVRGLSTKQHIHDGVQMAASFDFSDLLE
jgi:hypothetical protein